MRVPLLNCDMGESFGNWALGLDDQAMPFVDCANIACGFHAGDPMWMRHTVRLAEEHGVAVGAHPSFPDLGGFGRRKMSVTPEEAKNDIIYQIGALQAFTKSKKLQHVKPHGAMYNRAVHDEEMARATCEAILEVDREMVLVALAGSPWVKVAEDMGLRVAREVFADRALNADGTLISRSQPGAVIHDMEEVVERSLRMVTESKATAVTGEQIQVQADSLCLHGDTAGAVEMARALKRELEAGGVEIVPVGQLV